MSQLPPSLPPDQPAAGSIVQPHRGVLILVFGILAWVLCVVFGICAWVMGNHDLRLMRAGVMDRSGEGLTQAGRVVGMINVILTIVVTGLVVVVLLISMIIAGIGAAHGGAGGP